jgi:hypothetical protein
MTCPLAYLNGRLLPQDEARLPVHDAGFVMGATVTDLCRTFRLELLETRETISDTVFGPAVLASALALGDRLAPVASPLPPQLRILTRWTLLRTRGGRTS